MMDKTERDIDSFKLEFHFNKEGLFICGNQKGLSELAKIIEKTARVKQSKYHHVHLNLGWSDLLITKKFLVNFDWIKKKAKMTKKENFDITIMHTKLIGEELWGINKKEK